MAQPPRQPANQPESSPRPTEPPHRNRLFGLVVQRAFTAPPSLFLTTLGGLLIFSPDFWPAGLAAFAAEAAYLWTRIRDPDQARRSQEDLWHTRWRELATRMETLSATLDSETAASLAAVVDAQERLMGLQSSDRLVLPHSRTELVNLLELCLALANKRQQIQQYLRAHRSLDLQRQATQLQHRVDTAGDPTTRQLFEQALDLKRQELENYARLEEAVKRIDGQLFVVRGTFDNMIGRIVRLQSADAISGAVADDAVSRELNQLTARVTELEASLNETLLLRGTG